MNDNTVTGSLSEFNTNLQGDSFVSLTATETLTNKTLTSPTIATPAITEMILQQLVILYLKVQQMTQMKQL